VSGTAGRTGELSPEKRALLELLLRDERTDGARDGRIRRRGESGPTPQSFAQRRLWMLEALAPGTPIYTVRAGLRLTGGLDHRVLTRSVNEVVRRHGALRTTFCMLDGEPVQVVAASTDMKIPIIPIDGGSAQDREQAAWRRADMEAARGFDLTTGPLFRASLLALAPDDHLLLFTLHHIVADGWSLGILLRELATIHQAYARGEPSPLPEPPIQYTDYALWQHEAAATGVLREHLGYWTRQLAGLPALNLPTTHPRPRVPGFAGERQHVILAREVTEALAALSNREGATIFMTLQAALQTLLSRWSGQDDFGIGTPIANRTRAETENVIGFFLNTLVLRSDVAGDPTFRDLLARVRETTMAAYAHQELPFERLLEALRPPRDPSRTPLFQVFFNLLNFADERLNRPVVPTDAPIEDDLAQFDLTLYAGEHDHRLQLQLVYRTDLFDAATAGRLLGHLTILLGEIAANPDRRLSALPFVTPQERGRIARQRGPVPSLWPAGQRTPDSAADGRSVPARLGEQRRSSPQRIAVRSGRTEWSYHELVTRADRIARAVLDVAPGPATRIAVLCDHDLPMIAALIGVLTAGHAYVPLDPAQPLDRLSAIIDDARADLLLTDSRNRLTAGAAAGGLPVVVLQEAMSGSATEDGTELPLVPPDALAYLLYTSGSTGRPKGVVQSHRNLLHHAGTYARGLHLQADDRVSMLASYSFDAAVMDIYGALLSGATLCLYDVRSQGLLGVSRWIQDERITVYHSTPAVYRQVFESVADSRDVALRAVVLGGEEAGRQDVEIFRRCCPPGTVMVNGLGPTESTLALQYVLDHDTPLTGRSVPVGFPVEDTDIQVLNASGEQVDVYGTGTIVIRSPYLAVGYWRRPELTRSAFRPSPLLPGWRQYDTGDLGRLLPDGAIEFAGRRDRQLKIRGQRVELGEIEAVLLEHPAVRTALVNTGEHPTSGVVLLAYVVLRPGRAATSEELRGFLRRRLPDHMVPAAVAELSAFPVTINGKVDRTALPIPDLSGPSRAAALAPRNELERTVAPLFAAVLGLATVGVTDDFFELGGHSLLATQLLSRVRAVLGVDVPLRAVFDEPTVAGLARAIGTLDPDAPAGTVVIPAVPRRPPPAPARNPSMDQG